MNAPAPHSGPDGPPRGNPTGNGHRAAHGDASGHGDPFPVDRTPPHDLYAEQAVLGGMLLSRAAIDDVTDVIRSGDAFYRPAHRTVFEVIVYLHGAGKPADVISVGAELAKRGFLEKVGGGGYLHTLFSSVPTAANAGYYARIVAEKALLRGLAEAGTRIVQIALGNGDAAEALDAASTAFTAVADSRERPGVRDSAVSSFITDVLDELSSDGGGMVGLPTGLDVLDGLLGGLRPGILAVLGGRPSTGKSVLASDIVRRTAIAGRLPTLFCSVEMPRADIVTRMIAAEARVPLDRLMKRTLTDADWRSVVDISARIADSPLHVIDGEMNVMDIRLQARRVKRDHGLALVVVDYLQLLGDVGARRPENRQVQVAEMSRSLKGLAMELSTPVIALSQLNRRLEDSANQEPRLSDLRESGQIEQDADVVILLHPDNVRENRTHLIVAKNRNGRQDTVDVAAQFHYARFVNLPADQI